LPGPRIGGLGPARWDAGSRGHDAAGTRARSVGTSVGTSGIHASPPSFQPPRRIEIASSVPHPIRRTVVVHAEARMPGPRSLYSWCRRRDPHTQQRMLPPRRHYAAVASPHARGASGAVARRLVRRSSVRRGATGQVRVALDNSNVLLGPPSSTLVVEARPEALL
jgi:hypothetical protein